METEKTIQENEELKYTQSDVDNIVSKVKQTQLRDFEKKLGNYVAKTDYEVLKADYENLQADIKKSKILNEFVKQGGNDKFFNDFLKVNEDLIKEDYENLDYAIQDKLNASPGAALNSKVVKPEDFGINQKQINNQEVDYGNIYANASGRKEK